MAMSMPSISNLSQANDLESGVTLGAVTMRVVSPWSLLPRIRILISISFAGMEERLDHESLATVLKFPDRTCRQR